MSHDAEPTHRPWHWWVSALATAAFTVWLTSPLWRTLDRLFVGRLATDGIVTPWFQDWVGRRLLSGGDLHTIHSFDWPGGVPRTVEFPSLADAWLTAPVTWLLGWPGQWNASLALAVGINALGGWALTRALGLGPLAAVVAGCLAALARPVWADFIMARLNVAFPGLVLLALAGLVWSSPGGPGRRLKHRLAAGLLAAVAGGLGALIYPPFVLMMVPLGLLAAAGPLRRHGPGALGLPLLVLAATLAVCWPWLTEIAANPGRPPECGPVACADRYHMLSVYRIALWDAIVEDGLTLSGIAAAPWVLAPLGLLHRRTRRPACLLGIVAVAFAGLSMGPCPQTFDGIEWPGARSIAARLEPVWCFADRLHDWGRFASAAALLTALLAAFGVDALDRRRGVGRALALAMAVFAIGMSTRQLLPELLDPRRWHRPERPASARFLQINSIDGPVADLPYDRSLQFQSALFAPDSPRLNPLRLGPYRPRTGALGWVDALGNGRITHPAPTAADLSATGLEWIVWDASRCRHGPDQAACASTVKDAIESVVGEGRTLSDGLVVWKLTPENDASRP